LGETSKKGGLFCEWRDSSENKTHHQWQLKHNCWNLKIVFSVGAFCWQRVFLVCKRVADHRALQCRVKLPNDITGNSLFIESLLFEENML